MSGLAAAKSVLRAQALARRAACDPALGAQLSQHVLRGCPPPPGAIIAGYWPIGTEIDIRPLLLALREKGHTVTLPETPPKGEPLIFREWNPGDLLVKGRFNTHHPTGKILTPDFFLIPLLAFDAKGNRLGYGAGYYDRTLAALPSAYRLGCAFAVQQFPQIHGTETDQQLHAIATEERIIAL